MNNKVRILFARLEKSWFYFPVTTRGILFLSVIAAVFFYINPNKSDTPSTNTSILDLLIKVSVYFIGMITLISVTFILLAWSYLLYTKRRQLTNLSIDFSNKSLINKQDQQISISPLIKPLMGYIKLRFVFNNQKYSSKLLLHDSGFNFFSRHTNGLYYWSIPEINEYKIKSILIYFEDIFRFFSIAVTLPANDSIINYPTVSEVGQRDAKPTKTEETNTKIEQLRKVEGEFLNFKNFESNDDVRRIVWKIYARNKELVVRIPENESPYASHIYLCPSFYTQFDTRNNDVIEIAFLNYYKTIIWSLYNNMLQQGFSIKYKSDSSNDVINTTDENEKVKRLITTSMWQNEKKLNEFIYSGNPSVVVISSLSDAELVRQLTEKYGNEVNFVYVKLTDCFNHNFAGDWIKFLFIKNEPDDINAYRRKWIFSSIRNRILHNEALLEKCLPTLQQQQYSSKI